METRPTAQTRPIDGIVAPIRIAERRPNIAYFAEIRKRSDRLHARTATQCVVVRLNGRTKRVGCSRGSRGTTGFDSAAVRPVPQPWTPTVENASLISQRCRTPDAKMTQDTQVRRLHARVLARRLAPAPSFLLNDEEFRFAADCERMRVDRNGSVLSLLLIRLPHGHAAASDVKFMARLLEGRLRVTDTPGLLDDGRIAVLLPDTQTEGAWKVATDLSEVYPPGPSRPECDVLIYPPHQRTRDDEAELDTETEEAGELAASDDAVKPTTSEFFFATPTPRWKRAIDLLGGAAGLVVAGPIILGAAAAIKLTSSGPAFFVQRREGLGGRTFAMWKLRTMHQDAEEMKEELLALSQQDGPAFKLRKDPRTTRLGRLLRWTSIDELPQLWNVLRGEMSLVGPRPLPVAESQACEPWQRRRLTVTPGMTCTWQVSGRGSVSFDDWVRMDLQYAKRAGIWQDLKLIVLTLPALIFHRGMR